MSPPTDSKPAVAPSGVASGSASTPETKKAPRQIKWYRTPIDKALLRQLSQRSDAKGAMQTFGYLGLYATTAGASLYGAGRWPLAVVLGIIFLHGMVAAFMINAVHELGHGTVFKTKALNRLFLRVFAFLGWINFHMFGTSHARHHAYTLHPPDDLEVVLPIRLALKHFLQQGFINPLGLWYTLRDVARLAAGRFRGQWELMLYPPTQPQKRTSAIRWARVLLIGHATILAGSVLLSLISDVRWLMLPLLFSLSPFFGGWLFFLCNNTQHIGLRDNVPDFRLCCRTLTLNPLVRLLYWQMNYHTEHHMYPTVPCYNLGKLHRTIVDDLPPCPHGLIATWRQIIAILRKQKDDPAYQHFAMIPVRPPSAANF